MTRTIVTASTLLRAARERRGLSQHAAARLIGTSQARISRIEAGIQLVSREELERLTRALGLDTSRHPVIDGLKVEPTPHEWFISRVTKLSDADGACWLWNGSRGPDGYGQMYLGRHEDGRRKVIRVYRWSYEHFVGPIPAGLHIDHLCRNPRCVNPQHLEPVTCAENTRRGLRGRLVTHCPQGHEYTPENTRFNQGRRACVQCVRERQRRHYERNRDAINARRRERKAFLRRIDPGMRNDP